MDKLQKRLQDDAAQIDADVSAQLQARLDVSLNSTNMLREVPEPRRSTASLWWASSVTGLAAAMLVIIIINWNRESVEPVTPVQIADTPSADVMYQLSTQFPLDVRTADLTQPLEEELKNLQADLLKARESVAGDRK